jgi:hypothetical protein
LVYCITTQRKILWIMLSVFSALKVWRSLAGRTGRKHGRHFASAVRSIERAADHVPAVTNVVGPSVIRSLIAPRTAKGERPRCFTIVTVAANPEVARYQASYRCAPQVSTSACRRGDRVVLMLRCFAMADVRYVGAHAGSGPTASDRLSKVRFCSPFVRKQMRWMAPAHGI